MFKLVAGFILLAALGILGFLYFQKPEVISNIIPLPVATTTQGGDSQTPPTPVQATKNYTNESYRYSFNYPEDWILEPEGKVMTPVTQMPSIITVHEDKEIDPHRFSVTINRQDRPLEEHAQASSSITVDGKQATVHFFPEGYQCQDKADCSFFYIPIVHNSVTYEIVGTNDAKTLDAYRGILASFKFTK